MKELFFPFSSTSLPGGNLVDGLPPAPSSFCNLIIFPEGSSKMMSACKARALDEGGMIKTSWAQSSSYRGLKNRYIIELIKK